VRVVEDVRIHALQQTQEVTQVKTSEGIGVIRSVAIGVAVFTVLSVPLLLNVQTIKYNSQITNMTYEMNVMNSQITDQKTAMNIYLEEKFPNTTTFKENGQTFFVRSVNPNIKGDAKLAAQLTGQ
jgi:hypothetical protein